MCVCLLEDDWVYLPDERKREEYVMKEDGLIYFGTSHYPRPRTWDFGQVSSADVAQLSPHEKRFCYLLPDAELSPSCDSVTGEIRLLGWDCAQVLGF